MNPDDPLKPETGEKSPPRLRFVKTVSGSYRLIEDNAIVGWCHNIIHKGAMDRTQYKEHDCAGKQCAFFEKNEASSYWLHEKRKAERKAVLKRKLAEKKRLQRKADENLAQMKEKAEALARSYEYPVIITSIKELRRNQFNIYFISQNPRNDWYLYRQLVEDMRAWYGKGSFWLKRVVTPEGDYALPEDWEKSRKSR